MISCVADVGIKGGVRKYFRCSEEEGMRLISSCVMGAKSLKARCRRRASEVVLEGQSGLDVFPSKCEVHDQHVFIERLAVTWSEIAH